MTVAPPVGPSRIGKLRLIECKFDVSDEFKARGSSGIARPRVVDSLTDAADGETDCSVKSRQP